MWLAIRYLHVLSMAFFVGGQLLLAVGVVPALRGAPDRAPLRAIARRFGYGTIVAIAILVITGAAMASHYQLWDSGKLHFKLALVVLVGVLIAWHLRKPTLHALDAAIFIVSLVIVWLGLSLAY